MKPARSEYMPGGQAAERPRSTELPCRISMMTTGSVRGKCSAPQAGQARFQPSSATSERAPQRAQKGWVACQPRMPLAAAAVPASATESSAIDRAQVAEGEALGQAGVRWRGGRRRRGAGRRRRGASQSGISRAKRGAPSATPRKTGGSGGGEDGGAIGSQASRGAARARSAACPARARGRARGVGGERRVAAQMGRAVERARAKVTASASRMVPRSVAARPCRKAAAAAIGSRPA